MRLSHKFVALTAALGIAATASAARADILIAIDKSTQQMSVLQDGIVLYTWPVSTGASGYDTPSGQFKPFRMERDHFSREWDDAPMPNSIFFTREGHAIHGSGHVKAIGTPASHGCVRLEPKNASILFALVKREGMSRTLVALKGETPELSDAAVARRNPDRSNGAIVASEDDGFPAVAPPRRTRVRTQWYRAGAPYPYIYAPRYVRRYFPFGW